LGGSAEAWAATTRWADSIVESLADDIAISWCAVLVADDVAGALRVAAERSRGLAAGSVPFRGALVPLNGSLSGAVLGSAAPALVDDVRQLAPEPGLPTGGIRSVLAVPIVRDRRPIGVIVAGSPRAGALGIADVERLRARAADAAASPPPAESGAG
jgi:hypothetical protein